MEESKKWAPRMQRKTSGLKKCMTIRLNLINFGLIQSLIVMCMIRYYDFKNFRKLKIFILFFYFCFKSILSAPNFIHGVYETELGKDEDGYLHVEFKECLNSEGLFVDISIELLSIQVTKLMKNMNI